MQDLHLLDLANRKGKAPGGYLRHRQYSVLQRTRSGRSGPRQSVPPRQARPLER
jgi:hypothetical protein